MAKQTWNLPIDKHTEWSGDTSTQGLPVCGGRIEEFIKNTLEEKVGCIYYDTVYNRYMMFADEEDRDLYLSNPEEYASLVRGVFDAPFNYTAVITLIDTPFSQIIKYGSVGNVIKAEFDTVNKSGASVGEAHTVTITIKNGSSIKKISRQVSYDTTLELNVDEYLSEGNNTISIQSIGNDTLAATSQVVSIVVVRLELRDYFDFSYPYSTGGTLEINFDVKGSGIKHMLWWLDGNPVEHDTDIDDITATESPVLTRYIPYSLTEGRHNLQFRAYIEVDGKRFYSDTHFRDFIVKTNSQKLIVTSFDYPTSSANTIINAFTMPLPLDGLKQYEAKEIQFAIYNPLASMLETTVSVDGVESTYNTVNETIYTYQVSPKTTGSTVVTISTIGANTISFNGTIAASDFNLYEISNCIFRFNGTDRTNSSNNRDQWSYSGHSATFSGFTWNESNGWVGDGFLIGNGQKLSFNYAPLANVSVENGATIEFDFNTQHVMDENTVLCNLTESGVGITITASEAKIKSRGGVEVSTKYKAGEQVRVSFVINRYSLGNNKALVFIYVNGILSGAIPYGAGESFVSNRNLSFVGSNNAYIKISQIMVYNRPLTYNEILNNYILYQPTFDDILDKYLANDVYTENTETLSIDKVSAKVPVIIVTGDLEQLQNTTDKNKEVMMDKIEIINMDNPTLNLTLTNAIMRPQGTSSMSYPKKNFRIYSQRNSRTKMYDYQGNEVTDRLYAFKENAQRVNCWCLKADYAESSSAHNTGVARIWNDILKDVKITNINEHHYSDNQFVCRTQAQQTALDNDFDGDVRTCIDGFPICLFYHLNENDPLIFVGKYNFNNDKSTESVYGFVGIPDFDNSHVECWEITENGNTLALYTDVSNYDSRWSGCFEARYPDDNGKASEAVRAKQALKTFTLWVNSTLNDAAKFSTEKWDHIDVYKMAAYYLYAMRFGAVDQIVKNAMLTTEDGIHWFFINYDNDTIFGLRNDGLLKFGPDITRQSLDPSDPTSYCYAGHDSVLWNNFEADSEFMSIVAEMDKALYNAGLNYAAMIDMFNNKQSGKWGERIFNIDEQYKYVDVWNQTQNNQLEKLQGSRESHREWWINNRFNMYDEKNLVGSYKDNNIEIKPTSAGITGATISIRPASNNHYFGYGINNTAIESGVSGTTDADITFVTPAGTPLYVGDPVRFYNAKNIGKFDASLMAPYIQEATFSNINANGEESFLNDVILGSSALTNNTLTQLGSISFAKYLKSLDIRNYNAITTLNLSNNKYLESLNASGCSALTSVILPEAAPITALTLPTNMQSLILKDLDNLTYDNLTIGASNSLATINITNCPNVTSSSGLSTWLMSWYSGKTTDNANCIVKINGINWEMTYNDMYYLGQINADGGHLELGGHVHIDAALTFEQMSVLQSLYGNNCFDDNSAFYFTFITSPISNLSITLNRDMVSKNDTVIATASFSGTDFSNGVFTISDTTGLNVTTSGFSAIINTSSDISMKTVTLTYTVTTTQHQTITAQTSFDVVPYTFYLNNENLLNVPELDFKYNTGDTAKTYTDGWVVTCDDNSLNFSISNVSILGGYAEYSGHEITSITKTQLSNNTVYSCSLNLTFNNVTKTYNFNIKTVEAGNIITAVYYITDTANATQLLNGISDTISYCMSMKVDGVEITPSWTYLFDTVGRHTVVYEYNRSYNLYGLFAGIRTLIELYLKDDISSISNYFISDCLNLNKIYCEKMTAPTISANTFYYSSATTASYNKLYTYMGASGYNTTNWTSYLLNPSYGNFTNDYLLGWTGDENIKLVSSGSVNCTIVNNTGKEISAVTVSSNNSAVTVSNTTNSGFTLDINVESSSNAQLTGIFTFTDGTQKTLTKDISIIIVFKPFVLYNSSNSSVSLSISATTNTQSNLPNFDVEYYIADDYEYGQFDNYNFDEDKYQQYTLKSTITIPGQSTLVIRSLTMNTWTNPTGNSYNYFFKGGNGSNPGVLYGEGNFSALVANNKNLTIKNCLYNLFSQLHLLYKIREINFDSITGEGCLTYLFYQNYGLTEAPELPATTIGDYCYQSMFYNCLRLTTPPTVLPAITATQGCYSGMFRGCTAMTSTPEIMATAATNTSFNQMFTGCKNLTSGATMHVTSFYKVGYGFASSIYKEMYSGCTKLTYVPDITITDFALSSLYDSSTHKCQNMFAGCTSLTHAPSITINSCNREDFFGMFSGCTSLVDASNITIKSNDEYSCYQMFIGCTSLTGAPIMSAITSQIKTRSYMEMFKNCTSLVNAPELNSTSVANSGCTGMFYGCTNLVSAPTLKAAKPANSAYNTMFYNCNNLTGITINATALTNTNCVNNMITSPKLNTVTFTSSTAPGGGTNMFTPNVGTLSGTNNVIYVPQGATGYDTATYLTDLLDPTKGNFTISATL